MNSDRFHVVDCPRVVLGDLLRKRVEQMSRHEDFAFQHNSIAGIREGEKVGMVGRPLHDGAESLPCWNEDRNENNADYRPPAWGERALVRRGSATSGHVYDCSRRE